MTGRATNTLVSQRRECLRDEMSKCCAQEYDISQGERWFRACFGMCCVFHSVIPWLRRGEVFELGAET